MLTSVKRLAWGERQLANGRDAAEIGRAVTRTPSRGSAFFRRPVPSDPKVDAATPDKQELQHFRYCAFLSYGHRDSEMARWLHESLEKYRVPKNLIGRITANGPIPARLMPIFRDRHELARQIGHLAVLL